MVMIGPRLPSGDFNCVDLKGNEAKSTQKAAPSATLLGAPPGGRLSPTWERAQAIGAGLQNLGNTCYMNAVLQCLAYIPPLANLCLKGWHSMTCTRQPTSCTACLIEKQLSKQLSSNGYGSVSAAPVFNALQLFSRSFVRGRQEDSHEFLHACLDAVERDIRKSAGQPSSTAGGNKLLPTVMDQLFGGQFQSQVRCSACQYESNTHEPFMGLSLDINKVNSVEDSLRSFTAPEILDGSERYRCERCRSLVRASKQVAVLEDPNVLLVHLKRFDGSLGGKVTRHIRFSEHLDLTPHLVSSYGAGNTRSMRNCTYQLTGVVVHQGYSAHSGHYYAYVKDGRNQWYCMNDSSVAQVSLETVRSQPAYMLFYVRNAIRRLRPVPAPGDASINSMGNGIGMTEPGPSNGGGDAAKASKDLAAERAVHVGAAAGHQLGGHTAASSGGPAAPEGAALPSSNAGQRAHPHLQLLTDPSAPPFSEYVPAPQESPSLTRRLSGPALPLPSPSGTPLGRPVLPSPAGAGPLPPQPTPAHPQPSPSAQAHGGLNNHHTCNGSSSSSFVASSPAVLPSRPHIVVLPPLAPSPALPHSHTPRTPGVHGATSHAAMHWQPSPPSSAAPHHHHHHHQDATPGHVSSMAAPSPLPRTQSGGESGVGASAVKQDSGSGGGGGVGHALNGKRLREEEEEGSGQLEVGLRAIKKRLTAALRGTSWVAAVQHYVRQQQQQGLTLDQLLLQRHTVYGQSSLAPVPLQHMVKDLLGGEISHSVGQLRELLGGHLTQLAQPKR